MNEYAKRIAAIHKSLGIPEDYAQRFGIPLQVEATQLVEIGEDMFGRLQRVAVEAAEPWRRMLAAANNDAVELQLVSAYRSVDRQVQILQRKIDNGIPIEEILKVSAAPGYSEHHTGRALDLNTPGCKPLEEEFENTGAFSWLQENARHFGFYLSYPRDSVSGIAYEPWHWAFQQTT